MKKINAFRFLAISLIAIIGLTSCSKDEETNKNVIENAGVSTYLKKFYTANYQLGKSVESKVNKESSALSRTAETENFIITEVIVGDDTRARGYIITDETTNEFRYFIDVDRIDFKLTSVKIDVNDTKVFNNIDDLDSYAPTDGFDIIKVAKDINSGIIQSDKFWGWGSWNPMGPCEGGHQSFVREYNIFWMGTGVYDYDVRSC